jgi:hypothetical protein
VEEFEGSINMSPFFKGTGHEMDFIFVDMHGFIRVFNFPMLLI